ncbi:hypothetical protein [Mesoterricola silvestris]|uniref:Lipoprotein n=1 Tax=Mesoterricola silvestris TaxID=2927979 RepID=A0AA48GN84_9BACT|nr:hypothetical protein [Mesoterricola silvestris]BDU72989.1 hypothetical protein METEAL_21630 [Mesoterricola silvestris]
MNLRKVLPPVCAVLVLGCVRDKPYAFDQPNLQVRATFPGEPRQAQYPEDTPFGPILWYSFAYTPPGRMDLNYRVDVGNLPPGTRGGDTTPAALATFQGFLAKRLGGTLERTDLPPARGPGFSYRIRTGAKSWVEGIVVLKRGRLHHAQATVDRADDPNLTTFLGSFAVD